MRRPLLTLLGCACQPSALFSSLALLACACHPLALFSPPALPDQLAVGAGGKIEVVLDERAIPHIYGASIADVSFGLGFMHGRDRLFQVFLLRNASQGRLAELFGDDLLNADRQLRLVAYRLDEQYQALDPADARILEAYAAGLNAGAKHAGRSAEMALLRVDAPTFTGRDALSIMRLQAWQLGVDHIDELIRYRLLELLPDGDPWAGLLTAPVSAAGVPIIGDADPSDPMSLSAVDGHAASNSWVVSGTRTRSGHAVLANDPHLDHSSPGIFYLAHLETPGLTVAGATLPGAPPVVIGFGRHMAWGMTSSFADAQDLLVIKSPPGRDDVYELDGELLPFEWLEQTFASKSGRVDHEKWRVTRHGPLLPPGYVGVRPGDRLALSWGGFHTEGLTSQVVSGFFELPLAKSAADAEPSVEKLRASGQNVVLAFTDGSIGYRLAAFTPRRPPGESGRLPRDGSKSANGFQGHLSIAERPAVDNPPRGYIVAANQRVIDDNDPRVGAVGGISASGGRALRIHERLKALLERADDKPTADEILAIQQDVSSVEARRLLTKLVPLCPREEQPALCAAVARFDGVFSTDSLGALPFLFFVDELAVEVLRRLNVPEGDLLRRVAHSLPIRNALGIATRKPEIAQLLTREIVSRAAANAHRRLVEQLGSEASGWRYGALHTLQLKGVMARAPILGGYFAAEKHEEAGDGSTVRAEGGLPVAHGSCLRVLVEMSDPPVGRFTLDSGQSGHPNSPHWMDQYDDWSKGRLPTLWTQRSDVEAHARERISLLP